MKFLPATICCLAVIGSGVAAGLFTNRWEPAAEFGPVQVGMDAVPSSLGSWTGRSLSVEQDALDLGGIRAHLSREYRDAGSGRAVQLLWVAGKPGPIAVHTPDVCFQGAGFEQTSDPVPVPVGSSGATFWRATFVNKTAAATSRIVVYWGWNGGDGWEAADRRTVRLSYSLLPALHKLYLVTELPHTGKPDGDLMGDLPDRLLPELDRVIAPPAGSRTDN
jgi:hypothetical protein